MITKEKLISHIESFPENLSIDELIDRLVFVEKLEIRIAESKSGNTMSEADLKKEMAKWFE